MSDRLEYVETEEVLTQGMLNGDPRRWAAAFAVAAAREALPVFEARVLDDSKAGYDVRLAEALAAADAWVRGLGSQDECREAFKTLLRLVTQAASWEERRGKDTANPALSAVKAVQHALQAVYGQQPPSLHAALASREAAVALSESRRELRHVVIARHRTRLTPEMPK